MKLSKQAQVTGLSIALIVIVIANVIMFTWQQSGLNSNPDNTFIGVDGRPTSVKDSGHATESSLILLGSSIAVIILLITMVAIIAKQSDKNGTKRDERRKSDLQAIAQGFQAFYQQNNHYPRSTAYDSQYYTVINLTTDWDYYKLPDAEVMKQFIPNWPILDPLHSPKSPATNGYLYYPRDNGQSFDLYAHLESVDMTPENNYNTLDSIPENLGQYNYKLSSSGTTQPAASTQSEQPNPNAAINTTPATPAMPQPVAPAPAVNPDTSATTPPTPSTAPTASQSTAPQPDPSQPNIQPQPAPAPQPAAIPPTPTPPAATPQAPDQTQTNPVETEQLANINRMFNDTDQATSLPDPEQK